MLDFTQYPYFAGLGLVVTFILFRLGIKYAPKLGLLDTPDAEMGGRKDHEGAIPLIGGLIILPVYAALVYSSALQTQTFLAPLLGGVLLLLTIGALDDKFHLHPWARFIIQIWLACYVVIFCDANIGNLGNLFGFGNVALGELGGKAFSVICLVLLMNAINLLDGMDGLCGGFLLIALGWLMWVALSAGAILPFWAMAFLAVPIAGFLIFNARYPFHKKASAFLGDAGSLSLGLIVGWFAIQMAKAPDPMIAPVGIIWIMSVPIMDTFAVFFTRKKQGKSPFLPDRLHGHYKIQDVMRWKPQIVTPIMWSLAIITGAIGYYGLEVGIPEYVLLYIWSAILLAYTFWRLKIDGSIKT